MVLDAGTVEELTVDGKLLLPIGIIEVQDESARGGAIFCVDAMGCEVMHGLTSYSSVEARLIAYEASSEIETVLDYVSVVEPVCRDNPVLP